MYRSSFPAAAVPDPLEEQERRLRVGHVGHVVGQRRLHPRAAPGGRGRPQSGPLQVMNDLRISGGQIPELIVGRIRS